MPSKWDQFRNDKKYKLVDLGRDAVFFIPRHKLRKRFNGTTIEKKLHASLYESGFTSFNYPNTLYLGFWKNAEGKIIKDKCRRYEVAFPGKERIPLLLELLAEFAKNILRENCIFYKAGQYTCLVYPPSPKRKKE